LTLFARILGLETSLMKLTFDPDFDHGSWPGPLVGREAVAGEEWVGQAGLLGRLEVALGVGGPPVSRAERAASLIPRLHGVEGFWSASAGVDPLGTATRLLDWRDELWLSGWRGEVPPDSGSRREVAQDEGQLGFLWEVTVDSPEGSTSRLRELAAVTAEAMPGFPDRLLAVASALERRQPEIEEIAMFVPLSDLPPLWRTVFDELARRGVSLRRLEVAAVERREGDLRAAASPSRPFRPRGDGTLQLVRPHGPLAAAEEVAAWLAARAGAATLDGVVLIGADGVLDAALRRHGLPTTGTTRAPGDNLLLQILPLVLDLAWRPADPQRALQLLTLPVGPVPRSLARRLADALHVWPAVDSDKWREELLAGIESLPEDRRRRVTTRLATLFTSAVDRQDAYPVLEVERRVAALESWVRAKAARETIGVERWQPPLDQFAALRRLLSLAGLGELTGAQLQWFVEAATASASSSPPLPAQAGLSTVGAPGSIAGAARAIVWWDFSLDSVAPVVRVPLSPGESRALAAAGVELPDPGAEALRLAARWRRPLEQAGEALLLVSPEHRANGDEDFPHPLWDELAAGLSPLELQRLETGSPVFAAPPVRREGVKRAVVRPTRLWQANAGRLAARPSESPTSLSNLIGCSFKWSLETTARIRPGETGDLPKAEQLAGSLAHEILRRVLTGPALSPGAAADEAQRLFDEEGPRLAAPYFLPGADATRVEARLTIGRAAKALSAILAGAGMRVERAEENIVSATGDWSGRLHGRPDLVVGPPSAVVDLKWGWASGRRRSLEAGTALQLAAYSLMLRSSDEDPWPPVAYFILKTQQLLTTSPVFGGAELVRGADPEATWSAVRAAYDAAVTLLLQGELTAPGNPDANGEVHPDADEVQGERLVLAAPCKFCDLGSLCGNALHQETSS
jgi:hypothetical protein